MVQLTKDEIIKITMRLQSVRQGLVQKAPFYALLLYGLRFSLDDMVERVYTDGERIAFNPDFLKEISDRELEFIMLHEVSHVALGHPFRCVRDYDIDIFDEACDIVVNSNIYHYMGDDESFITIKGLGVMPHKNYRGEEGYKFTVEQVYEHLFKIKGQKKKDEDGTTPDFSDIFDEEELDEDFLEDDELEEVQDGDEESDGEESDGEDYDDDSSDSESGEDGNSEDGNSKDGVAKAKGKGNGRGNGTPQSQTSSNQSAGGRGSFQAGTTRKGKGKILGKGYVKALEKWNPSQIKQSNSPKRFDDHSFWTGEDKDKMSKAVWENRVLQTCKAVKNIKRIFIDKKGNACGNTPCFAERMLKAIAERTLDWKTLLNDFIQEDICDYSFSPPDRRFGDSDFFLPDFNEKEETVENLLFMIDTSGSMSDDAITEVYSEIKGAIEQFNGKIKGWLGFFDATVTEPQPFDDEDEFKAIRIQGGGGTAFLPIFHYVRDYMKDKNITTIIILTDGYAPYPEESERMDIPVLWIINNDDATPPWGMIARIPQETKMEW